MVNGWMVKAGEGAVLFEDFIKKGCVAIGWHELGDIIGLSEDDIREKLQETYPYQKKAQLNQYFGSIRRFLLQIKKGDTVVSYDSDNREYAVGEARSEPKYDPSFIGGDFPNVIGVDWEERRVARDELTAFSAQTLTAWQAVFQLPDGVLIEMRNLLGGRKEEPKKYEDFDTALSNEYEGFKIKAMEAMKDVIANYISPREFENLVAGIFRAMGYKTKITPQTRDRGVDIIAGPDVLGIERPRILIEVKKRAGQISPDLVRSFIGVLRKRHEAGILVNTGGFSENARYEAERADVNITLVDFDSLISLIIDNYEEFDGPTKKLLPLDRIYWPTK